MGQISFEDLVNGVVPDASDFNSRLNALKNRINNGMEADNIADSSITTAKLNNDAVTLAKQAHGTLGGIPYYAAAGTPTELAGNTEATQKFLAQTGDGANSAVPVWTAIAAPVFESALLHVRDEKSAGTGGGSSGSSSFVARVLNTVVTNEISGASLSSNQITLPAGTYYIEADAPGSGNIDGTVIKLRNITDSTDAVLGRPVYTVSPSIRSLLSGRFTIAGIKVFELQHYVVSGGLYGNAGNRGITEIYADARIWKVA